MGETSSTAAPENLTDPSAPLRLRERAPALLEHLRERTDEMVELLRQLTEMESPSTEPESHDPVFGLLADSLDEVGFRTRRVAGRRTGGALFARGPSRPAPRPAQLVIGHVDTVWPLGTLEEMPFRVDGEAIHGPGVFDMKGGLVQLCFALRALRELELDPAAEVAALITSDEEIGSPESEGWIRMLARRSCRALVLEPALGPEGALKTARKGTGHFEIRVRGREAHVGLAPEEGASAIQELSHVIQRVHELSDARQGVSVNVGEIQGGIRPNVVAPVARAVVDVRVPDPATGERVARAIRSLEARTPGTRLEVDGGLNRPPMVRSPGTVRLWHASRELGQAMGLELKEGVSGGASDGNITSELTPTLDGLGAVGDGAHARHEHVVRGRLPERAALLALLLLLPPDAADAGNADATQEATDS